MPVRTYQDAVEYLTDVFDHDRAARQRRNMRRAVEEAYRELPQLNFWSYYRRRAVINTVASQTTGTISYTHSSRAITLSGATFPSDASSYRIIISGVHYDIESYTDSTHVVLSSNSNPGADVASSTSYTLYKNEYLLPENFRRLLGLWDVSQNRLIQVLDDTSEQTLQVGGYGTPGTPHGVCVRNTGETTNRLSLVFNPPPSNAVSYDLLYEARPRTFVIPEKHSTGTVTVSSGGTAVTGSGTSFPSNCAGCLIRFSANESDEPTGPYGSLIDGKDVDNPAAFESIILSYTSATAITLKDAANAAYSAVKYSISDPLDIEDGAMFTAFEHLCAARYARMMGHADHDKREAMAMNSIVLAKEFDNRKLSRRQVDYFFDRLNATVTTEGV